MTTNPPARLFVLLARSATVGVILRRGPSEWVQMIKWETKKDVFTPGQWFHGRVYEHKCDLSPNGELFVYFAKKYTGKRLLERKYLWTAISKPPHFTALDIQFDVDTWGGGGVFPEDRVLYRYSTSIVWSLVGGGYSCKVKRKSVSSISI